MGQPDPNELIARVRALPAADPLLARLGDTPGVYLVGGAVRDLLLGGQPTDLDLVVDGDAAELALRLGDAPRSHERFGTATVRLGGHTYDIAAARREHYPAPGALPVVEPAGLAEDLERRDFTVNAMAIALSGPGSGELQAVPRALADLDVGQLRVLHEASFSDDPTRLLRLVRYSSRLGFEIESATREFAERAVAERALRTVSGPRIGTELRLLAREPDPVTALAALAELGLDEAVHPGVRLDDPALARRGLALLPDDGRSDLLVLAVALRGVSPPERGPLLDALAFEAGERDLILACADRAHALAESLSRSDSRAQTAQVLAGASPELVALAGAFGPDDRAREWLVDLRHIRLEISGRDLLAAGVPEGPAIGRALRAALCAKLEGRADGRDAELAEALRAAGATG